MKTLRHASRVAVVVLTVAMLGGTAFTLAGCKTDREGVTNTAGAYSALVNASPTKVTDAAKRAVEDLKLVVISSAATELDGRVIARTAQDTKVGIDVAKKGDNVSEVTVRVGTLGDEAVSLQIIDRIKANL